MANYLVVGASSGIGYTIAKQLTEQGHEVYTASRRTPDIDGIKHTSFDVTEGGELELPEQLDGLVYCPGTINLQMFQRLKADDFQNDFDVNLKGAVNVLQQAFKPLRKSKGASVVLFSTVAVQTGMAFHASIAAAKGAIEGLARSLAAEWASHKIRVNAVAPSLTDTPLAEGLMNSEQKKQGAEKRHPLQRVGTTDDIANAALFLLSGDNSWITGQVLTIDGGIGSTK